MAKNKSWFKRIRPWFPAIGIVAALFDGVMWGRHHPALNDDDCPVGWHEVDYYKEQIVSVTTPQMHLDGYTMNWACAPGEPHGG